jgi:hypothetical protein
MEFCRVQNISIACNVYISSFKGLIVVYLTTPRLHCVRIIIGKGCRTKASWPNARYYPGIWPERLKKTMKNFSQNS